jgi:hypothetical protein
MAEENTIRYRPSPTASRFHRSRALVRGLKGPIGTGKSVACVMEIFFEAMRMPPSTDGVRRSRWLAIRNTYPELLSTTLQTWEDWFPMAETVKSSPIKSRLCMDLPDGTKLELQMWFLSMDKPKDMRKLKSLDATGGWLNEASELSKGTLDMMTGRIGRFPAKRECADYRSCIIMDTNPPDTDHWWYQLAEIERPEGFEFFDQPPAIRRRGGTGPWEPNPEAENVMNHVNGFDYWLRQVPGKRDDWIKVMLCGQYGATMDGKPVYPNYRDDVHCPAADIEPMRGLPLLLGFDWGRTPACAIAQLTPRGQLRIIDEIVTPVDRHGTGVGDFVKNYVVPYLKLHYAGMEVRAYGDPAGVAKEGDDKSSFDRTSEAGIVCTPASTNDPVKRIEAVDAFLMHMVDGQPGLLVSKKAHTIRRGFQGRYLYERKNVGGYIPDFKTEPAKNAYSHPHDALQYVALMASGGSIKNTAVVKARPVTVTSAAGWT